MSIKSLFEDIADAIREKSGSSDAYTPAEMPSAIRSIPSGSSTASGVSYDNTASGLTANNVQDAIDELAEDVTTITSDLSDKVDKTWIPLYVPTNPITSETDITVPSISNYNELLIITTMHQNWGSYTTIVPVIAIKNGSEGTYKESLTILGQYADPTTNGRILRTIGFNSDTSIKFYNATYYKTYNGQNAGETDNYGVFLRGIYAR